MTPLSFFAFRYIRKNIMSGRHDQHAQANPREGGFSDLRKGCLRSDRGNGHRRTRLNHHVTLVQTMQLKEGDELFVLIKATEAMIERPGTEAV